MIYDGRDGEGTLLNHTHSPLVDTHMHPLQRERGLSHHTHMILAREVWTLPEVTGAVRACVHLCGCVHALSALARVAEDIPLILREC